MKPKSMKITSATMTVTEISFPSCISRSILSSLTAKEASVIHASGHLSQTLATALDDQDDIEEELEALKEIYNDTSPVPVDAESNVAVVWIQGGQDQYVHYAMGFPSRGALTAHRVPRRIKTDEHLPELHTGAVDMSARPWV